MSICHVEHDSLGEVLVPYNVYYGAQIMFKQVTITQIRGSTPGREYRFDTNKRFITIGRAPDCAIQVEPSWEIAGVSRHHCRLEIAPPHLLVCDLSSLNGTFLNESKIGQRDRARLEESGKRGEHEFVLRHGDELRLGASIVFRVDFEDSSECEIASAVRVEDEHAFVGADIN
jgi:eukaryotic-like serine/threonine-protein kinase